MRLSLTAVLTLVVGALMVSSCDRPDAEPALAPLSASVISAETLWNRITVESDYTDYGFWPGHEGENPGQSPHGSFHRIYVNRSLLEALPIADRVAPDGALIVKENLTSSRELDALTVMAKVDGFDPEHSDWFWAKYAPDGTVQAAGSVAGCISCHEGVAANDYVIVRRLDVTGE